MGLGCFAMGYHVVAIIAFFMALTGFLAIKTVRSKFKKNASGLSNKYKNDIANFIMNSFSSEVFIGGDKKDRMSIVFIVVESLETAILQAYKKGINGEKLE